MNILSFSESGTPSRLKIAMGQSSDWKFPMIRVIMINTCHSKKGYQITQGRRWFNLSTAQCQWKLQVKRSLKIRATFEFVRHSTHLQSISIRRLLKLAPSNSPQNIVLTVNGRELQTIGHWAKLMAPIWDTVLAGVTQNQQRNLNSLLIGLAFTRA